VNWPSKGRTPSPASTAALALSLLAHLALLSSAGSRGAQAGAPRDPAPAPAVLTVQLLAPRRPPPAILPAAALPATPAAATAAAGPAPALPAAPAPAITGAVPELVEGPAITTPAKVAEGLHGAALLVVADLAAGPLAVRFWIDEHGTVERLQTGEQRYSESDAAKLQAALLRLRFHPARAGQLAVRSELQLDLLIVNSADL
jgi:hypothetical protein